MAQPAYADETLLNAAAVSNQIDEVAVSPGKIVATAAAPAAATGNQPVPAQGGAPVQVAQLTTDFPEQVVVSATRRETFLQDTPIAISAVSSTPSTLLDSSMLR